MGRTALRLTSPRLFEAGEGADHDDDDRPRVQRKAQSSSAEDLCVCVAELPLCWTAVIKRLGPVGRGLIPQQARTCCWLRSDEVAVRSGLSAHYFLAVLSEDAELFSSAMGCGRSDRAAQLQYVLQLIQTSKAAILPPGTIRSADWGSCRSGLIWPKGCSKTELDVPCIEVFVDEYLLVSDWGWGSAGPPVCCGARCYGSSRRGFRSSLPGPDSTRGDCGRNSFVSASASESAFGKAVTAGSGFPATSRKLRG